jgi:chemotaxis regulatin CheY-phosphate phosphatase CheZ
VPDARDRLRYVATMTEQAAERVLNAIEIAKPVQERIQNEAEALDARWAQWYAAPIEHAEVRELMDDTRTFLHTLPEAASATSAQLLEIMLAQDFQDLTGQVIKKIMDMVYLIEQQLLTVLVENIAPERREQFAATAAALAAEQVSSTAARVVAERPADRAGRQVRRRAGSGAGRRSARQPRFLTGHTHRARGLRCMERPGAARMRGIHIARIAARRRLPCPASRDMLRRIMRHPFDIPTYSAGILRVSSNEASL